MVRYRLTERDTPLRNPFNPRRVEIVLRARGLHERAPLEVTGHDLMVAEVLRRLIGCCGFRGRSIEEETTPLDLHSAMCAHFRAYAPELIEGADILAQPL